MRSCCPTCVTASAGRMSAAGFMNTINAAGYLAGALAANIVIRRIGLFNDPHDERCRLRAVARDLGAVTAISSSSARRGWSPALLRHSPSSPVARLRANIAQAQPNAQGVLSQPVLCRPRGRHPDLRLRRAVPARLVWPRQLVGRVGGARRAFRRRWRCCYRPLPVAEAAAGAAPQPAPRSAPADHHLSDRLRVVRRRLYRLHDLHDRLCAQRRRRRDRHRARSGPASAPAPSRSPGPGAASWRKRGAAASPRC